MLPVRSFLRRFCVTVILNAVVTLSALAQLPTPTLLGYWHNWDGGGAPYLALDSLDARYNVIAVSFALPVSTTDMTMTFAPARGTQQEFVTRIQRVRAQGKKVLLSIGGATASVDLTTGANRDAFTASLTSILTVYGFDGLDIDIEHGASILINGGTIVAPQNVAQIHLISALRTIMTNYRNAFGRKMLLTFAPETAYVQGGMSGFGSIWGGYLPLLHAMRDSLDLLHVQLYNSGTMYGIDGNIYAQATADFLVAMTEAVIQGFTTRGGGFFTGLPATKVLIGLPASTQAAGGGFCDTTSIRAAVRYLRGQGPRPGSYVLARSSGYADLQGMMTWSVNWDATTSSRTRYQYAITFEELFGSPQTVPDICTIVAPQNNEQLQRNDVVVRWRSSRPSVTAYHLDVRVNSSVWYSDSTLTDTSRSFTLPGASTVQLRVRARNARGWGEWSPPVVCTTVPLPDAVTHVSPANGERLGSERCVLTWRRSSPAVDAYRVRVTAQRSGAVFDTTVVDTTLTLTTVAQESYVWTVCARNLSGWNTWSAPWSFLRVGYPAQVVLIAPGKDSVVTRDSVRLHWYGAGTYVDRYHVEVREEDAVTMNDSLCTDTIRTFVHTGSTSRVQWRVRAHTVAGWGEWSDVGAYVHLVAPGAVVAVSPADSARVTGFDVSLHWSAAQSAVTAYEIHLAVGGADSTMVTTDTVLEVRLPNNTDTVRWRVRARNAAGSGPWTRQRVFTLRDTVSTAVWWEPAPHADECTFTVFPNPGTGMRMITSEKERTESVIVADVLGRVVFAARLSLRPDFTVVPWLPEKSGTYFLRVGSCVRIVVVD